MVRTIYTIGHSSHELDAFFALLQPVHVERIVDVRRSARSTRFPQYNLDAFKQRCTALHYSFQGDLLGARRRRRTSCAGVNDGLPDADAHAYADHMQRPEFGQLVGELVRDPSTLVLMCSENDPEQCHRSLLADYLCLVHELRVVHILFTGETREHRVHPLARLNEARSACVYPRTTVI